MGRKVRRVPINFDWPINKVWDGYFMPDHLALPNCPACELPSPYGHGNYCDGYSPEGREIAETFYPHMIGWAPRELAEQLAWHDKLTQDEVDYLVEKNRMYQFGDFFDRHELPEAEPDSARYTFTRNDRPAPSAERVNAAERMRLIHDAINRMYLIEFRCERLDIETKCAGCGGKGHVATADQEAAYEAWGPTEPPTGEGWQLWETVSEGSPISPAFATSDGLAVWMADPARGNDWMPHETAAKFVAEGWAPTFVGGPDIGLVSGAEFIGFHADSEAES